MNWIDKLERRYGRFGIPHLVNGLLVGQLVAGLIVLLINWQFSALIALSRTYVLHGQIWRLITFLFQPIWLGSVLGILNLVFYFWIGNALTRVWGDFRMTLFIALGVVGAWVSCLLTGSAGPSAIFQSMLFAYTWLWPDQMVLLFLVVAAFAVVFSLVFSQIITKPISALTKGIQTMARGDFSTRVKVRGSGEMRRLARTFNSMSEKIESLDQARNQFVSNASHELKTPLATMKILIESLIYQPEMETGLRTEFLSDINREIDRLSSIVTDLLTLVRMDVKDVKLSRENMSLAELVKDTEHLLKPMAEKRHQTLVLSLQDECDMYADRTKLQQVVYNLMENAFKYTQDGGKVTVTLQKSGRDAVLKVKDNGPGIAAEHLPHIFDRFYRVDKARSREAGGTGLGLAIVHQLVMLHGGEIHVESEVGKGTTFTVELPLHQG